MKADEITRYMLGQLLKEREEWRKQRQELQDVMFRKMKYDNDLIEHYKTMCYDWSSTYDRIRVLLKNVLEYCKILRGAMP